MSDTHLNQAGRTHSNNNKYEYVGHTLKWAVNKRDSHSVELTHTQIKQVGHPQMIINMKYHMC